jgi:hypothetical protein
MSKQTTKGLTEGQGGFLFFLGSVMEAELDFFMERVYLQSGLEKFSFNPLRGKQIDHLYVYFKKSHDSLKISCD